MRYRLPDTFADYERGHADTVLRYADRSYESAKWTRLRESTSFAELVGLGANSISELWRVAGWDDDNLWVANDAGRLFQLQDGHWRYAGLPEFAYNPRLRVLGPNIGLIAGGRGNDSHCYQVSPSGVTNLATVGRTFDTEIFPAENDLIYCFSNEDPALNLGGTIKITGGIQTALREDLFKEAFVHRIDNTPIKERPIRFLRHCRSHRAGTGYAVSPTGSGGVYLWGKKKLVRFENGIWYEAGDLPDKDIYADVWVTGSVTAPHIVVVGKSGWVHVKPNGSSGAERALASSPEPTPANLIKVWGGSPDKFWVMDDNGTIWELGASESRVVVRGMRRDDVTFRDAWVSPKGTVFAITDKHLYRLD